jgi:hypothetical protein
VWTHRCSAYIVSELLSLHIEVVHIKFSWLLCFFRIFLSAV